MVAPEAWAGRSRGGAPRGARRCGGGAGRPLGAARLVWMAVLRRVAAARLGGWRRGYGLVSQWGSVLPRRVAGVAWSFAVTVPGAVAVGWAGVTGPW